MEIMEINLTHSTEHTVKAARCAGSSDLVQHYHINTVDYSNSAQCPSHSSFVSFTSIIVICVCMVAVCQPLL